jgi:hypothetical protein
MLGSYAEGDDFPTARRLGGCTLDDWENRDPQEGRRIELVDGRFVVNATGWRESSTTPSPQRVWRR